MSLVLAPSSISSLSSDCCSKNSYLVSLLSLVTFFFSLLGPSQVIPKLSTCISMFIIWNFLTWFIWYPGCCPRISCAWSADIFPLIQDVWSLSLISSCCLQICTAVSHLNLWICCQKISLWWFSENFCHWGRCPLVFRVHLDICYCFSNIVRCYA